MTKKSLPIQRQVALTHTVQAVHAMIDYDELRQFLKDNLSIDTKTHRGYYGEESVSIQLKLGDKVISDISINMPKECTHDKGSYY